MPTTLGQRSDAIGSCSNCTEHALPSVWHATRLSYADRVNACVRGMYHEPRNTLEASEVR